jgi:hypothetical protein
MGLQLVLEDSLGKALWSDKALWWALEALLLGTAW